MEWGRSLGVREKGGNSPKASANEENACWRAIQRLGGSPRHPVLNDIYNAAGKKVLSGGEYLCPRVFIGRQSCMILDFEKVIEED